MSKPTRVQPHAPTLDDYRWLVGSEALAWLEAAARPAASLAAHAAKLRAGLSPERTHLVLEQVELRQRAGAKFAAAETMFFTRRGLEQATDELVAAYKAARFPSTERVADLCCGVGGDLIALAARGGAIGVDRDPIMAVLAEANARAAYNRAGGAAHQRGEVRTCDAADIDVGEFAAWHIDPDRRPRGSRTTQVDLHEPGPELIDKLLARNPAAAIKLAPAAQMPAAWSERAELEWISRDGECRQLVAWFGDLATEGPQRRATVLRGRASPPRSFVGVPERPLAVAVRIGRYLYEPDAAILAAGLEGALAAQHGLAAVTPGVAYWTADQEVGDPAVARFEVREVLPLRLKPLKALLRTRDIGRLEIKKRGVDVDPAKLRGQLELAGSESATLLLVRIGGRVMAILAARQAT
jgi:SAM-dependent methyltransferase